MVSRLPSHFHWIDDVNPETGTISEVMRDIRKYSAWEKMDLAVKKHPEYKTQFEDASMRCYDQKRKFWMPRFDDEVIRNERMLWTKIHYIHNNPVKAGPVDRI